jgi:hypothetical protein
MESDAELAKMRVYKKYGIDQLEESPSLILHNAVTRYSEQDPDFVMRVAQIERDYKMSMARMMEGALTSKEKEEMAAESDEEEVLITPEVRVPSADPNDPGSQIADLD